MTKVIQATCLDGTVKIGEAHVQETVIFSEGIALSEGVVVFEGAKTFYLAKTSPDLKTTLGKIAEALGKIASAIDSLDGRGFLIGATGQVVGPPVLAATVAEINGIKGDVEALESNLK